MSEIPVRPHPRRLVDWINPTGAKKVHSLVDKVYKQRNLEIAWERVRANRGSGGVDGQTLEQFAAELGQQLGRLQRELQEETYQPQPVRQVQIPKAGKPGEFRTLGIPTIYDRVCQQALLNRLDQSSSRYSMMPTSDIDEGGRPRTPCVRCGKKFKADRSGLLTAI